MAGGTFTHTNMRQGPAVIYFATVCVGVTVGDVEFTPELTQRMRQSARYGETPIDFIHTGENYSVKVQLAEYSIAALAIAFPEGSTSTLARYFGRIPGGLASAHYGRLIVRPVDLDASDSTAEDLVFHKAVVTAIDPVTYNHEGERIFAVTFTALVDDDQDDGKKLGFINGLT